MRGPLPAQGIRYAIPFFANVRPSTWPEDPKRTLLDTLSTSVAAAQAGELDGARSPDTAPRSPCSPMAARCVHHLSSSMSTCVAPISWIERATGPVRSGRGQQRARYGLRGADGRTGDHAIVVRTTMEMIRGSGKIVRFSRPPEKGMVVPRPRARVDADGGGGLAGACRMPYRGLGRVAEAREYARVILDQACEAGNQDAIEEWTAFLASLPASP